MREKGFWRLEMGQFPRKVRQALGAICYESGVRIRVDYGASFPWAAVHENVLNATLDPAVDPYA